MVQPQTCSPITPSLKLPSQKLYLCSCQARLAALALKGQSSKTLKVLNFEINGHAGEFSSDELRTATTNYRALRALDLFCGVICAA